jgi:hypothetical protein
MLESISRNTNVILPQVFMKTIKHAIRRDGIALARVHPQFLMDVTYGARDPVGMIKFRLTCFPDIRSWKVIEVCVMYVVNRLESRIRLAGDVFFNKSELHSSENEVALGDKSLTLARFYAAEKNIFRDLLLTLFQRFYSAWAELKVPFAFLIYEERRPV